MIFDYSWQESHIGLILSLFQFTFTYGCLIFRNLLTFVVHQINDKNEDIEQSIKNSTNGRKKNGLTYE